jgi:hypothetical protein
MPGMFWVMLLFWVIVAITIGGGIVYLGFGTSWNYYLKRAAAKPPAPPAVLPQPTPGGPDRGGVAAPTPEAAPTPDEIKTAVLQRRYESVNIGGAVVLIQTLRNGESDEDVRDEEIAVLFDRVKDKDALVNVALAGRVLINEVKLNTINVERHEFEVVMLIKNLTSRDVVVNIPQGQVFENKEQVKRQNLAALRAETKTIPASASRQFRVRALCMNKGFDEPRGSLGNITIFELKNKRFINQQQLWDAISSRLEEDDESQLIVTG